MEKVFQINQNRRQEIPAVTHVDGSGRMQTVDKTVSPRYYNLIAAFKNRTGVPILLNTSFNENEPIVNHSQEALHCFLRTDMDMLVMENVVVERGERLYGLMVIYPQAAIVNDIAKERELSESDVKTCKAGDLLILRKKFYSNILNFYKIKNVLIYLAKIKIPLKKVFLKLV